MMGVAVKVQVQLVDLLFRLFIGTNGAAYYRAPESATRIAADRPVTRGQDLDRTTHNDIPGATRWGRRTSRPVSRIVYPARAPGDGHPSRPAVAGRLERSTRRHRTGRPRSPARDGRCRSSLLDLAPGGVYR